MLSLVAMALAASDPVPAQLDEVSKVAPPVNWTVVLDSSADMLDVAKAARVDVAALANALPVGDSLEVLAFHTRSSTVLPRVVIAEADRVALVDKIKNVAIETAHDADLGAGLEAIGLALRQGKPEDANQVLVVSRFCHQPSISSAFDTGVRGCRPIRGQSGLVTDIGTTLSERDTITRLFPVASKSGAPDPAGLNAAKDALRAQAVLDQSFSAWLTAVTPRIALERLRPTLTADIARAALTTIVAEPGRPDMPAARILLRAPVRLMKINLTDVQVTGAEATSGATLTVSPEATLTATLPTPGVPFALFRQDDVVTYDLGLSAGINYAPADVLRALDLPTVGEPWTAPVRVDMPRSYGLPAPLGWLIIIGGFVAMAAGLVAWRLRSVTRELGGAFYYRVGTGPRVELEIAELASAGLVVENGHLVVGPEDRAVLVFRMTGPRWRSVAEVEVKRDGVEMNRRALARGVHPVTPGAASFQFEVFRLTWE